jgi:hypothetical protein
MAQRKCVFARLGWGTSRKKGHGGKPRAGGADPNTSPLGLALRDLLFRDIAACSSFLTELLHLDD